MNMIRNIKCVASKCFWWRNCVLCLVAISQTTKQLAVITTHLPRDILGFLFGLATSRAALVDSLVLDFHHWWHSPSRQFYLPLLVAFTACRRAQGFNSTHPETAVGRHNRRYRMKQVWILLRPCVLAPSLICNFHVLRHKRSLGYRHVLNQNQKCRFKISCIPLMLRNAIHCLIMNFLRIFTVHTRSRWHYWLKTTWKVTQPAVCTTQSC